MLKSRSFESHEKLCDFINAEQEWEIDIISIVCQNNWFILFYKYKRR